MPKEYHVRFGVRARIYPVVVLIDVEPQNVEREALKKLKDGDFELDSCDDMDFNNLSQPAFVCVDVYDSESHVPLDSSEFDRLQSEDVAIYPEDVLEYHARDMYNLLSNPDMDNTSDAWKAAVDSLIRKIDSEIKKVKEMQDECRSETTTPAE